MQKYKIILKQDVVIDIEAENVDDLYRKIDSGVYKALPVHSNEQTPITRQAIKDIIEVK